LLLNPKALLHQGEMTLLPPDRIISHEPDQSRLRGGSHRISVDEKV
jgi:hypothetical protein